MTRYKRSQHYSSMIAGYIPESAWRQFRHRAYGQMQEAGGVMECMYTYRVVREYADGQQGKRTKLCHRYKPLAVGGLYTHLGAGFPGQQRVLGLVQAGGVPEGMP